MTLIELIKLIYEAQVIYLGATYYIWLPASIFAGLSLVINIKEKDY